MKSFWMLLAAMSVAVTGCNKEDGVIPDDFISEETNSVKVRLSQGVDSRAEGSAVSDNAAITMSEGYIYFASATSVTKVVKLTSTTNLNADPVEVSITALTGAGETITDVPDNTTQIYLLSNLPAASMYPTAVSTPNATLEAIRLEVEDMYDSTGGVSTVSLYGKGTVDGPLTEGDPATASLTVDAVSARLEINELKGTGNIVSFELVGIYINNYYGEMAVNGKLVTDPTTSLVDNGSDVENYGGATDWYTMANGILYDSYTTPIADVSKVVTLTGSDIWAYQFFPVGSGDEIPHIVIELADVVVESEGVEVEMGTQYLTVTGFKDSANQDVDELKKGYVYKINIEFDETHIETTPEVNLFSVEVDITVTPWKAEALTPVL